MVTQVKIQSEVTFLHIFTLALCIITIESHP